MKKKLDNDRKATLALQVVQTLRPAYVGNVGIKTQREALAGSEKKCYEAALRTLTSNLKA